MPGRTWRRRTPVSGGTTKGIDQLSRSIPLSPIGNNSSEIIGVKYPPCVPKRSRILRKTGARLRRTKSAEYLVGQKRTSPKRTCVPTRRLGVVLLDISSQLDVLDQWQDVCGGVRPGGELAVGACETRSSEVSTMSRSRSQTHSGK